VKGTIAGHDESPSAQRLGRMYAQLQASVKAITRAIELNGPSDTLRAELIVLAELVDGIGDTVQSMSLQPVNDTTPLVALAPTGATESAMLAQTLRAIKDLRELRELNKDERQARELAEAQQVRAAADFRTAYREARALTKKLDQAYLETITALAKAVEARDHVTGHHVERVRAMSVRVGQLLRLTSDSIRQLEFGAVLHDVGKIGLPDSILGKPGALSPEEIQIMRQHPLMGRKMLEGVSFLHPALPAVEAHHERWDGLGYPHGLSGSDIPVAGRIVAVVDAFDAMTSDRPYRKALSHDTARSALLAGRGTQFDPVVVDVFLDNLEVSLPITPDF
jgi:HD-GYP domain-containing protein (c-di-GMP phosphodiesterase class II)